MSAIIKQKIYPVKMRRICAFIIDICVVGIITYLLYVNFRFPDVGAAWQNLQISYSGTPAEKTAAFMLFDKVYFQILLIWFIYEVIIQFILKGATLGKLAMHISVVPINPKRSKLVHYLLMTVRTFLKVLLLYIFNGIPFLVAALMIFATSECQSGYDLAVKSTVRSNEEAAKQVKQKFVAKKARA